MNFEMVAKEKVGFGCQNFKEGDKGSYCHTDVPRHILICAGNGQPFVKIHVDDFHQYFTCYPKV